MTSIIDYYHVDHQSINNCLKTVSDKFQISQRNVIEVVEEYINTVIQPIDNVDFFIKQRRSHEDALQFKEFNVDGQIFRYYAVFDGHGGDAVMNYCKKFLYIRLFRNLSEHNINHNRISTIKKIITDTFIRFDKEMLSLQTISGSTCSIVLIDVSTNHIYQINAGDSFSILINQRNQKNNGMFDIVSQTVDHDPYFEKNRIEKAGGFIAKNDIHDSWRIKGQLAVSRGFGDFKFKVKYDRNDPPIGINTYAYVPDGMVSVIPDIIVIDTSSQKVTDIIMSSDGIKEFTNYSYTDIVRLILDAPSVEDVIEYLLSTDILNKTSDDISVAHIVL